MKGSPDFPQCGFSAQVVDILNFLGVKFSSYNVLDDNELREGIKKYSEWPTIPQIYIKKSLLGAVTYFVKCLKIMKLKAFKGKEIPFKTNPQ